MHVGRPAQALIEQVRVDYIAFDLLALDADLLLDDPYTSRRAELSDLRIDDGARVRVPPSWSLADHDAAQLLHTAADAGLEGIVSKRGDAIYEPGRRSSAWIKTVLRATTEAVIVGAMPGSGANAATFGGLVLAGHTPKAACAVSAGSGPDSPPSPGAPCAPRSMRSAATPALSTIRRRRRCGGRHGGSSRCWSPTSSTARSAATAF